MHDNPYRAKGKPRHWFQFRLSTWFVLVGILAWAIATWPWIYFVSMEVTGPIKYGDGVVVGPMETAATRVNPAFKYPAIALAIWVVWKLGWIAGQYSERRKTL